jgi:KDO2-lipid IV(A) lauroyltransferase
MGRRRPASPLGRLGQQAVAASVTLAARAVAWLPPRIGARLGAALGAVAYGILPGRRRIALANVSLALGPALSSRERAATVRASFRHLGTTAVECCRLFLGRPGEMLSAVRVEGLEHVKQALADGRGAFYLGAHLGNWELLAAAHAVTGVPLSVVVRPLDNPYLEAVLARGRERHQVRPIPKRVALRGIRVALARNECVGILLDQNAGPEGVFVPFFGQLASTSRSLAVLALKTGAAVLPAFIRRLPDGDHEATIEPPIPLVRTGHLERDVAANTARFTEAIERRIRTQPEQWFWVHRRWKTRPIDMAGCPGPGA